jgi:zinc protease
MVVKPLAPRFLAWLAFCLLGLLAWAPARAGLAIQNWSTPQGARVYFVENHDLPMLDLSVGFAAGSARDRRETSGLAGMTRGLMPLGAGGMSERDISERLADVGAQLGGAFDADRAGFSIRTLSGARERDQALAVLKAILSAPQFAPDVLEREKARAIAGLKEAETKPEYLGEKAFQAAIFPAHPYGLPEGGEVDSLARLTRDDLLDFHRRHYRAANMTMAIMGDVTRAEAERLAADLADGLPPGPAPAPLPPVAMPAEGGEQVIPHHATQSHLFVGQPGLKRDDPDYFPLLVGNYVLGGGGFDSRLLIEIRQKRGLAYSAHSYFAPMRELGPFQIGLQTRRDATREALEVLRATLARFLAEGPSEAELTQAKNNLIGGFPLRLDSNRKILGYLEVIGFHGLPLDWLDQYTKQVAMVSREDIQRAFRARLRPEAMQTVIVGGQLDPVAQP